MRTTLTIVLSAAATLIVSQSNLVAAIPHIGGYLLSSAIFIAALLSTLYLFRNRFIRWLARRAGGSAESLWGSMTNPSTLQEEKASQVLMFYLNSSNRRFLISLWLAIGAGGIGLFSIHLVYEQNKVMRSQTLELSRQWKAEQKASLLGIIYDVSCAEKPDEEITCKPKANSRARQEALDAYIDLQRQAGVEQINLSNMIASGMTIFGDYSDVSFGSASFKNANVIQADIKYWIGADFSEARIVGLDFRNLGIAELRRFNNSRISATNFAGASLAIADFRGAEFGSMGIPLDRKRAMEMDHLPGTLAGTSFQGADLLAANFAGSHIVFVNFSGAHLMAANFQNAGIHTSVVFDGSDLHGADFTGAYHISHAMKLPSQGPRKRLTCEPIRKAKNWTTAKGIQHCLIPPTNRTEGTP